MPLYDYEDEIRESPDETQSAGQSAPVGRKPRWLRYLIASGLLILAAMYGLELING